MGSRQAGEERNQGEHETKDSVFSELQQMSKSTLESRVWIDVLMVAPLMIYGGYVTRKTSPGYRTALMGAGGVVLALNLYKLMGMEEDCGCGG